MGTRATRSTVSHHGPEFAEAEHHDTGVFEGPAQVVTGREFQVVDPARSCRAHRPDLRSVVRGLDVDLGDTGLEGRDRSEHPLARAGPPVVVEVVGEDDTLG